MQHIAKQVRFWSRIVFVLFALTLSVVIVFPISAQEATALPDTAQLRLGHFVFDESPVNLYVDGKVTLGEDGKPSLFSSLSLPSQYLDLGAGEHTFAVTAEGNTLDSALVSDQPFTLEVGRRYLLALMGNASANDLHFSLIDETAALEAHDITQSAVSIFINNLAGVPAIDLQFNGQTYVSDLAYGDYVTYQDPTEGSHSFVIAHGDPSAVILDNPAATGGPAHFFAVFVLAGIYSGTPWEGYSGLYTGSLEGGITVADGGSITVGDSIPVEFAQIGQRVRYTLTLDAPATLDILELGEGLQDAFLRMYDTSGNLLYENDEESAVDDTNNAGWRGLSLEAGTYILEAATFVDIGSGMFTLSVNAAD